MVDELLWKKGTKALHVPAMQNWKGWKSWKGCVRKCHTGSSKRQSGRTRDSCKLLIRLFLPSLIQQENIVPQQDLKIILCLGGQLIPNFAHFAVQLWLNCDKLDGARHHILQATLGGLSAVNGIVLINPNNDFGL